jgi:aspartokinase-like uncharacterized kinase
MQPDDQSLAPTVIKVGGSLFDLVDLGPRLERWLEAPPSSALVLVPGGGLTADVVRGLDRRHGLGEEAAHWLALRALTLNAYLLAQLLKKQRPVVSGEVAAWPALWRGGNLLILDAYAFAQADERRPGRLPACWEVTSDSVAARVAVVARARRLMLLKSVTIPADMAWDEAGRQGFVDSFFAAIVAQADLNVAAVNFRASQTSEVFRNFGSSSDR